VVRLDEIFRQGRPELDRARRTASTRASCPSRRRRGRGTSTSSRRHAGVILDPHHHPGARPHPAASARPVPRRAGAGAMNRSELGTRQLNARLQEVLNPPRRAECSAWLDLPPPATRCCRPSRLPEEVFNGDICGVAASTRRSRGDGSSTPAGCTLSETGWLTLAFATTIHQSPGLEYPACDSACTRALPECCFAAATCCTPASRAARSWSCWSASRKCAGHGRAARTRPALQRPGLAAAGRGEPRLATHRRAPGEGASAKLAQASITPSW